MKLKGKAVELSKAAQPRPPAVTGGIALLLTLRTVPTRPFPPRSGGPGPGGLGPVLCSASRLGSPPTLFSPAPTS